MQNFALGAAGVPHDGHRRSSCDPQDMQNLASAGLAVPQLSQVRATNFRVYVSTWAGPQ